MTLLHDRLAANATAEAITLQIGGIDLQFENHRTKDPILDGAQIAKLSGFGRLDELLVLQWLPDGGLEDVRARESIDLRDFDPARFVVALTDRTLRLEIEGELLEWPGSLISGMTLKRLGGRGNDDVVATIERRNGPDEEIEDEELLHLNPPGIERVYFKAREKTVRITVNTKQVSIDRGRRTGLEIKEAAIAQGVAIALDFVLSVERGPGQTDIVGDADRIRVREDLAFIAVADDDNS